MYLYWYLYCSFLIIREVACAESKQEMHMGMGQKVVTPTLLSTPNPNIFLCFCFFFFWVGEGCIIFSSPSAHWVRSTTQTHSIKAKCWKAQRDGDEESGDWWGLWPYSSVCIFHTFTRQIMRSVMGTPPHGMQSLLEKKKGGKETDNPTTPPHDMPPKLQLHFH